MVAHGEVVEPDVAQVVEQGATLAGVGVEELVVDRDADLDVQAVTPAMVAGGRAPANSSA